MDKKGVDTSQGLEYSEMNMYAALFTSSFFLAFSGAMMPGPLLTATISATAQRGPTAGPLFIIGHGILEMVLVVLLVLGIGPLLTSDWAFVSISLIGAGVMLYMAWDMFRSLPELSMSTANDSRAFASLPTVGALLSVSNPYWIIWWGTIGLGFLMRAQKVGVFGILAFFTGHILGDLVWYGSVSFTLWRGRRLLTDRLYRGLIALCGFVIAAFGLYFLAGGIAPILEVLIQ